MLDPESTPQDTQSFESLDAYDSPLEQLQLLGEDDASTGFASCKP
jgi:hypothetical protein